MKRCSLTRKTPMQRGTEFADWKRPARTPLVLPEHPPAPRVISMRLELNQARPKFIYVRSELLRIAVRSLDRCQACNTAAEIHWAHSNWAVHGKGFGIKASDQYTAALCLACHRELDQGKTMTEAERQAFWWAAHVRTVELLLRHHRWPQSVPVPDIKTWPFAAEMETA